MQGCQVAWPSRELSPEKTIPLAAGENIVVRDAEAVMKGGVQDTETPRNAPSRPLHHRQGVGQIIKRASSSRRDLVPESYLPQSWLHLVFCCHTTILKSCDMHEPVKVKELVLLLRDEFQRQLQCADAFRIKIVRDMKRNRDLRTFATWAQHCLLRKYVHRHQGELARLGLLRVRKVTVATAFSSWKGSVGKTHRLSLTALKIGVRQTTRLTSEHLAVWQASAAANKRIRHAAGRIVNRWRQAALAAPFAAWSARSDDQKRLARKTHQVQERCTLALAAASLSSWRTQYCDQRRLRRAADRVLSLVTTACVARALAAWREAAGAKRWRRSVCNTLQRVFARIGKAAVYTACSAWSGWVKQLRRQRVAVERMAACQRQAGVYSVFATWEAMAGESCWRGALLCKVRVYAFVCVCVCQGACIAACLCCFEGVCV